MTLINKLKKKWRDQRLHIQIAMLSALIIAITLIIDGYLNAKSQSSIIYERTLNDALALSKNIAVTSAYQISINDLASLESLLLKSIEFPDIVSIKVVDTHGNPLSIVRKLKNNKSIVVYNTNTEKLPDWSINRTESNVITNDDHIILWQPIMTSTVLGWIKIEYNINELSLVRAAIWKENMIATLIAILLDIIILMLILRVPMRALENASDFALNLHKIDGKTLAIEPSSYEVHALSNALNETSKTLYRQNKVILETNKDLSRTAKQLENAKEDLERKVLERTEQLSWQATHDSLTLLYNRREFENILGNILNQQDVINSDHYLCYIDLDQFKVVNDTCGHIAGDELLRQISHLLSSSIRKSDILARLGGDEFGVILIDCPEENAIMITDNILTNIKKLRFAWKENIFRLGASIGLVPIKDSSQEMTYLLSAADIACYAAKENGRNQVKVFTKNNKEHAQRRGEMQWAGQITQAIEQDKLCLFQQKIKSVANASTQKKHCEILIRMMQNDGKLSLPGAFLPAAERYGHIVDIDRWVIQNSFRKLHDLQLDNTSHDDTIFSINLSGSSLGHQDMASYITDKIKEHNLNPNCICFEITETAAITHMSDATKLIHSLKEAGCLFALDDFGTGLASFSYLKNLPVDYIKIDGSFVQDIILNKMDMTIVESVNKLGHAMGLKTIAEFVESEEISSQLSIMGIDYLQGYHIHEPSPISQLESSLT